MRIWKWIGGLTGFVGLVGIAVGVLVGVPVADHVDRYFSSQSFCADGCHTMGDTVAGASHALGGARSQGL